MEAMMRTLLVLISLSLMSIGSATASTIFIAGASGIPEQVTNQENGCLAETATGRMLLHPYPSLPPPYDCLMAFPINLPVGSTIDGVEIAYRDDSGASGRSITAYLALNRIKPYMGPLAVGGTNDLVVPTGQHLTKNMGSLSVPVLNGDIFWVQVSAHRVTEVDYVAVTYH